MSAFEFLADVVLLAHAACSMFLVWGLVLMLAGVFFGWQWTRLRWFRLPHLAATLFLLTRVWLGLPCPFSYVEDHLRCQTLAPCPLGDPFHNTLHRLAYRGTDSRHFARGTTWFTALSITIFFANSRRRTDVPAFLTRPRPSRRITG